MRGKDVFVDRFELDANLELADTQHWAPNCATFSRAREIPVPGAKNAPVPLRSDEFPEGIPDEVSRLSSKARKRLDTDTCMADLAADSCVAADEREKGFTFEHPACMFEGSRRKKYQALITNRVEFESMGRICNGNRVCDRTGEPHLKWRPVVHAGRVLQFTTGDEREYPKGFCQSYAKCLRPRLSSHESFMEIFSGPNAPLSSAVAEEMGVPLPGSKKETQKGVKSELQHLSQLIGDVSSETSILERSEVKAMKMRKVENSHQRAVVVEAGKQPGYGKRAQLIPDGIQDPLKHLGIALTLGHPFDSEGALQQDHSEALRKAPDLPCEADRMRLEVFWGRGRSSLKVRKSYPCSKAMSNWLAIRPRDLVDVPGQP